LFQRNFETNLDPTRCKNTGTYHINVYYSFNNDVAFYITLAL
jgi:hypothetical protein